LRKKKEQTKVKNNIIIQQETSVNELKDKVEQLKSDAQEARRQKDSKDLEISSLKEAIAVMERRLGESEKVNEDNKSSSLRLTQ
jgi:chromosome segregation ATPase